jgi:hypothetical protein
MILPALFVGTMFVILGAFGIGLRFGKWRSQQPDSEPQLPARMIIGSILNLLAFLLAFTFGLAASHYDSRNQSLQDEASAIGIAYHRTALLPAPERSQLQGLIREYVDLRLNTSRALNLDEAIPRMRQLQERIWTQAISTRTETGANSPPLLMQSITDMIDVQSERVLTTTRARIPAAVWGILYVIAVIAIAAAGYHSGIAGNRRRSYAALAYALVFAAVVVMIADADSPDIGRFRVNHQALLDLRTRLIIPHFQAN